MMKLTWIAGLLGGIGLGAAGFAWFSSAHAVAPKPAVTSAPNDTAAAEKKRAEALYITALQSLASMPRPQAAPPPAPPVPEEPVAPPRRPTEEELKRDLAAAEDDQAARLEQHRAEPRDQVWASTMEDKIDGLVRARADAGLGVYQDTDCRSQTCVVNFSWASYAEARADMRAMMARTSSLPCATALVLPPDDGRGDRVGTSVYVDCTAERSSNVSASR